MSQNNANRLEALLHMRQELMHGSESIDNVQQLANNASAPAAKANAPRPS